MAWPDPQPAEIADRLAAGYETEFAPIAGAEGVDARSPKSPLTVLGRVQAGEARGLYIHQSMIMKELFPDSAEDLARHGDVWGVPRRAAAAASGHVVFAGPDGLVIPSLVTALRGNILVTTTEGGTISGGTLVVAAEVAEPGSQGNLPTDTVLNLTAPIAGLASQSVTVAAPGFSGGRDQEELEDWRDRILRRIRQGVFYGQKGGYEGVALAVSGVAVAREIPGWVGRGTVGVVVAMGSVLEAAAPTVGELADVQAALDDARPVTAEAHAIAAVIEALDPTIFLEPDTPAVRETVAVSIALFLAVEPGIGGTLKISRLSEAISSADGEYAHRIDDPAADLALAATHLLVPGTVDWAAS